jgi:hypothetical protein
VVSANNNRDRTQFLKLKLEIYLGVRELAEKIHALGPELLFLCGPLFIAARNSVTLDYDSLRSHE